MTACHVAATPSSNHYVQVRGGSGDVMDGQSRGDTWCGGWLLMTRYKVAGQSQLDTWEIIESILRRLMPNPPVILIDTEESDDVMEVIFDEELFSRQQSTTHVIPPPLAYTPPPPFLTTMEPLDTLLIGDGVISTTPAWENDEFIKSSVNDLVPILRESEVTLVSTDLECSMPIDSPHLPCTDVLGD
ncbi:hypothetical protein Tco_0505627 [Tanacetum coccineum]